MASYIMQQEASIRSCSPGWLVRMVERWQGFSEEGLGDRPGGLTLAAWGSDDRTIAGMDARGPIGTESIGDLAENHRGAELLLIGVAAGRHAAVVKEGKDLAMPRLDLAQQLAASQMESGSTEQGIQAALGLGGVSSEGAVRQLHHAVAAVDGVLYVRQNVGHAGHVGLIHLSQVLLTGAAVGDPGLRPIDLTGSRRPPPSPHWGQRCAVQLYRTQPVGHAIGPHRGFVQGDDGSGKVLGLIENPRE